MGMITLKTHARAAMELAILKIRNGPDFGSPQPLLRKKLLTVLSDSGKTSSIIDRVRKLYSNLPPNAMLVICTGHGDTAIVQR
nr:small RNA degrading nuclease 5 isoform X1 [Ipomoea batatas]GME21635.1 small RNA degrading nuclease 5 isoform X1 [Ipomoea batatas]